MVRHVVVLAGYPEQWLYPGLRFKIFRPTFGGDHRGTLGGGGSQPNPPPPPSNTSLGRGGGGILLRM